MHSNKNEKTITGKTEALSGIASVARNFDAKSCVAVKAKRHSKRTCIVRTNSQLLRTCAKSGRLTTS